MAEEINFLKMLKMLMIISGIWRLPLKAKPLQRLYNNYSIIFQSYFYGFVVSMAVAVPIIWKYSMEMTVECCSVLIFCITIIFKTIMCQTDTVKNLLKYILKKQTELKNSIDNESKQIYIKHQNVTYFFIGLITFQTGVAAVCLLLTKYHSYWDMETNQSYPNITMYRKKPLPYVIWLPFNSDDHYVPAFILHSVAASIGVIFNAVTITFYLTVMIFIRCQLKILQLRIRTLDTTINKAELEVKNRLRSLIIDHQAIIE